MNAVASWCHPEKVYCPGPSPSPGDIGVTEKGRDGQKGLEGNDSTRVNTHAYDDGAFPEA